jgi:hypothetical protein
MYRFSTKTKSFKSAILDFVTIFQNLVLKNAKEFSEKSEFLKTCTELTTKFQHTSFLKKGYKILTTSPVGLFLAFPCDGY